MIAQSQDFIVAFTPGAVSAARLGGEMVLVGAGGLTGPTGSISSALMIDPTDGRSKVFAVSGENEIIVSLDIEEGEVTGGSIEGWANAVAQRGEGTLPSGFQLVSTWLGRAVLASNTTDPQNYAMSRTGNPLDWNFTADPQATTPILGRNSKAGVPGDAITALIPTWDDVLFFGCSSSIWAMNGDPSFGGRVDQVSNKTGVLGQKAWTFDSRGNLYVMGTSGFFAFARGSLNPETIADSRLDDFLRRVDVRDYIVQLVHNPVEDYIHLYFTPADIQDFLEVEPGTPRFPNFVYDIRNDALWPWSYPILAGPVSVVEPTSPDPEERAPLLGGIDGRIRSHRRGLFADSARDESALGWSDIPTFLRFPAFEGEEGSREVMLSELQATIARGSTAPIRWRVYGAESRDAIAALVAGEERASGLWNSTGPGPGNTGPLGGEGGFQRPVGVRVAAPALAVEIEQNDGVFPAGTVNPGNGTGGRGWGLERIVAYPMAKGRRR